MKIDEVVQLLADHCHTIESYVLVRELKVYLKLETEHFHPRVGIKVWKSDAHSQYPYHFTVSHHVHTPTQAGPYHSSRTSAATESEAILEAISTTTVFLQSAIREGHEPREDWLVPNEDF